MMRAAIARCRSRFALAALCAVLLPACAASTAIPGASVTTAEAAAATPPQPRTRSPLAGVLGERGAFAQFESMRLRSGCTQALCGPDQIENFDDPAPPGCTPVRCSVQVDAVEWVGEAQELRVIGGARIELVSAGAGPTLELADQPFAAARVGAPDAPWGLCLALSHGGLGQSGRRQRWTTLLLVPLANGAPGRSASRLTGWWASCEDIEQGAAAHEVLLPLVEPGDEAEAGLLLSRYRCIAEGCRRDTEATPWRVEINEAGELLRSD